MMTLRNLALFIAPLMLASSVRAETYPDCEKFDEPLAYNQCLAAHGPSAAHALASTTEGGAETNGAQLGHPLRHGRGGRMSTTFVIEDAHPAYQHRKFRRMR